MLRELIYDVAQQQIHSTGQLWNYRFSGNTLEMMVTPDYTDDPEAYRNGVIQTGRVLQALEGELTGSGRILQIQSFPSLDESRLVAVARLQQTYGPGINGMQASTDAPPQTKSLLKSYASQLSLSYQQLPEEAFKSLETEIEIRSNLASNPVYFALCSAIDNPFIWLKTGKWIEKVQMDLPKISPRITYDLPSAQRSEIAAGLKYCNYVQAVIDPA
ncbi:MAG: hypothetical protein WD315_02075 [Balneolaceae bacterium]